MTTYFRTTVEKEVGVAETTVLSTTPANIYTIIGLSVANIIDFDVIVDVYITDASSTKGYYIKQLIIPPYTSAKLVQNGEKIILGNSCSLSIVSDTADSLDVIASYAEIA
jgi:hypothetical protein